MTRSLVEMIAAAAALILLIYLGWQTYRQKGWRRLATLVFLYLLFIVFFFVSSAVFASHQLWGLLTFGVLAAIFLVALYYYYRMEAMKELKEELRKREIKTS